MAHSCIVLYTRHWSGAPQNAQRPILGGVLTPPIFGGVISGNRIILIHIPGTLVSRVLGSPENRGRLLRKSGEPITRETRAPGHRTRTAPDGNQRRFTIGPAGNRTCAAKKKGPRRSDGDDSIADSGGGSRHPHRESEKIVYTSRFVRAILAQGPC